MEQFEPNKTNTQFKASVFVHMSFYAVSSSKEMGFLNPNFPFFGERGVLFSWDDAS